MAGSGQRCGGGYVVDPDCRPGFSENGLYRRSETDGVRHDVNFEAYSVEIWCRTGGGGVGIPAAFAADAAADSAANEIVVTGTRISNRVDLQAASPVTTVSAETLAVTNTNTAVDYLTQMSQFVGATTGATNNGQAGYATVDLRGLGPSRTLVLVDGNRMVPADITGPVDINAIPVSLIKRVDVLTGGASAVYGADAIAGVVNFVLDDKFVGLKLQGGNQITQYNDGEQYSFDGAVGFKLPNEGHLVIGGQYTFRQGVYESARAYSACCGYSSNAVPTVIDINSGRYQLDSTGTFGAFNNPYNFNPANYLIAPMKEWSAMAIFTQPIAENTEFYLRGTYVHSDVTDILAPTATGGYNFTISPTNPYLLANPANYNLIFGDPGNLNADGTANVGIRRRIVETGGRIQAFQSNTKYVVGGFRGELGSKFHWDVFGQYGSTDRNETLYNDLSYNRTQQAVNAVSTPNGPACADPSGGCVPINLFTTTPLSGPGLAYVLANGHQKNHYEQEVAGGSLNGTLDFLRSPWAAKGAAVAVGVEYRREEGSQSVDAAYGSGDLIYYGQGTEVPGASFNAKEIFGELKMPIISDKPFIQQLNFEGGLRYSAYTNNTTAGTNKYNELTYKFGGDWTPVEGLRFRALFNRSIRDPNVNELNSPLTQGGTDVLTTDPCANGRPQTNAALAAVCIAQGAPANLVHTGVIQDVIANQVNILTGGNTGLRPEKSDTITIGAVFAPAHTGLHVTVDYYHIKITDYITSFSSQGTSDNCFVKNISSFCSLFVRNSINGQLSGGVTVGVVESLINIASLTTSGIDVTADYRIRLTHNSSLTFNMAGTYVDSWVFNAGGPIQCAGRYGNACSFFEGGAGNSGNPIPHWKHIASLTYQVGKFSLYGAWRYMGAVTEDSSTVSLLPRIASYSWFDATATVDLTKNLEVRLGIKNMFNLNPPNVGAAAGSSGANQGNTFPQVYDPLGQTFFASASVKF